MKDHIKAMMINELRDIAKTYHAADQLRDRIARCVNEHLQLNKEWRQAHENTKMEV